MADEVTPGSPSTDLTMEPREGDHHIDTKDERLEEVPALLKQIRDRLDGSWTYWEPIYTESKSDVKFAYEEQWPEEALADRANRPTLRMNMIPQFVHQVTGQARQSKLSIKVRQMSGKNISFASAEGSDTYTSSQVMGGVIRNIEHRSKAQGHYIDALQHAVEGGIGWLYVRTVQPPDDPFSVEVGITSVKDRWSVLFDPMIMTDAPDAQWCSMGADISTLEFEKKWPNIPIRQWAADASHSRSNEGAYWKHGEQGNIRVVDYWYKEPMERVAIELVNIAPPNDTMIVWEDEARPILDELQDAGYVINNRKKVNSYKVKYVRCVYDHILEGPLDWPSMYLPLVPVFGRKLNLDKEDHLVGLVRYAKDPQRMYNYWVSAATERVALSPRSPYMVGASQIEGFEGEWNNMYMQNRPYLPYNDDDPERAPPRREQPASIAAGELQMTGQARASLQDTVGVHDANLGVKSNETSGRAIAQRQQPGHISTYEFIDNLAAAVAMVGEICCDMVPRMYNEDKMYRIVMPDDTMTSIQLNHLVRDEESGMDVRINSLDLARYSCSVSVGPATATQRQEFVEMFMELGRSIPQVWQVCADLMVMNLDLPFSAQLAQRMKGLVPYHLLSEEDRKMIPPPVMTPEQEIQQLQAQAQIAQANADIQKSKDAVRISELKVEGERQRAEFEKERGINREAMELDKHAEKMQQQGEGQIDETRIVSIVEGTVAKILAKQKPKA